MDDKKHKWTRRIAYMVLGFSLSLVAFWFFICHLSGEEESLGTYAVVTLVCSMMILTIHGVQYLVTGQRITSCKEQILNSRLTPEMMAKLYAIRLWDHKIYQDPQQLADCDSLFQADDDEAIAGFSSSETKKRRGKSSKYPYERRMKAVIKWERLDPSFSALTLEEFLKQEFGETADGIMLVPPTTFYGWRKQILRDLQQQGKPIVKK